MPDPEPEPEIVLNANSAVKARLTVVVVQDEQYQDLTPEEFHQYVLEPSNHRCRGCFKPGDVAPGETNTTTDPNLEADRKHWRHLVEQREQIARVPKVAKTPPGMAHEAFHTLLRQLGKGCYFCKGEVHYLKAVVLVVLLGAVVLTSWAASLSLLLLPIGAITSLIVDRGNQSICERTAGISSTGLGAAWDAMGFSDDAGDVAAGNTSLPGTNKEVFALDGTPTRSSQTASYVRTLTSAQFLFTIKWVALLNGGAGSTTTLCAAISGLSLVHGAFKMKFTIELTHSN